MPSTVNNSIIEKLNITFKKSIGSEQSEKKYSIIADVMSLETHYRISDSSNSVRYMSKQ